MRWTWKKKAVSGNGFRGGKAFEDVLNLTHPTLFDGSLKDAGTMMMTQASMLSYPFISSCEHPQ
jgi:hypothetical protein